MHHDSNFDWMAKAEQVLHLAFLHVHEQGEDTLIEKLPARSRLAIILLAAFASWAALVGTVWVLVTVARMTVWH
ncbi:hypothetical protein [Sphingomonas azotifigens]|uniref:hypothetical protein n=1 Tax=Sphingomonas azotifigens TaxID=330920 RepID=UPI00111BF5FF|nr:hypothetical protein [Sphingomonas azotifigens]